MKIKYWSDYACPYCYIGNTRLEKAIADLNLEKEIDLETFAFELDQNAPKDVESTTVERFALKYGLSLENAEKEVNNISKLGIDEGIDFKYATTLYTNTRDAHRLMKFAKTKDNEIAKKLNKLMFDAYFTKNLKLADKNVLMQLAEESGLEKEECLKVLDTNLFNTDVEKDENLALAYGIHAVPYYIFDDKYAIPGALSYEDFKTVLKQIKSESEVDADKDAANCEDGVCRI